ncbi:MAG: urea ABC transporter permease subunit UrtB, partial [Rhodobacterales bacterium CG_4_10_14_0_8_um_filter_70_9]
MLRALIVCVALLAPLFAAAQTAKADTLESLAPRLAAGSFNDRAAVVEQIAATGDPRAAALLEALLAGDLQALKADGRLARVSDGAA